MRITLRAPKRHLLVNLLVGVALIASSCASDDDGDSARDPGSESDAFEDAPPEQQTLTLHIFQQKPNLDPGQQTAGGALTGQYAEALMRTSPTGDVAPGAASGFDVSQDQTTYTFRLRPDGMFNDGAPVTAQDFVYAWRRLVDPRLAAPKGDAYARVVKGGQEAKSLPPSGGDQAIDAALDRLGLAAPDPLTFVVTLQQPVSYFKYIATLPTGAPVRKAVADQFGASVWASDMGRPERVVTNGPFRISEVTAPNAGPTAGPITMVPNPHYTPKPVLTKIVNTRGFGPGKLDALWAEYLTNERDLVQGPTPGPSRIAALNDSQYKDELYRPFLGEQVYLAFNTAKAPFNNVDVRRAFAQAIDRQAAGNPNGALPGETRAVTSLVPQGAPGHNPDLGKPLDFNCNNAKASLAASGFTPATLPRVTITLVRSFEPDVNFVRDQVKNCLDVDMQISAPADNVKAQTDDYQAFVSINAKPTFPDPQELFDALLPSNSAAITKWIGGAADAYIAKVQQASAVAGADRLSLLDEAQGDVVNDVPVTFLWEYSRPNWIKSWVKGLVRGIPFDNNALPGSTYTERIRIARH